MQIFNVGADDWWKVARSCSYATFFHTPLWQQLTLETHPHYRDATIGAVFPSGTRAVLPLVSVRRIGPLHDLHSTGSLCYGGLIADGPISDTEAQQLYRASCNWRALRMQLTSNPLPGAIQPAQFSGYADETYQLVLNGDFATTFAGFSKSHQTHYRRGVRRGVQVRLASTLEEYRQYFAIYQDTIRRWRERGLPFAGWEEPWRRFEVGAALAHKHPELMKLWLAEKGGEVISGAWVFYWNQHAVYWHGATAEHAFDDQPSVVVHTEIIRHATEANYRMYDFNPSGALPGVAEFKRRFGAERRAITRYLYGDRTFQLARTMRAQLRNGFGVSS